jgi:hypothetical protein
MHKEKLNANFENLYILRPPYNGIKLVSKLTISLINLY